MNNNYITVTEVNKYIKEVLWPEKKKKAKSLYHILSHPDRPHIYYSELYPAKPSFPTDYHTHTCLVAAEDNQYKKIMPAYVNRRPAYNCI